MTCWVPAHINLVGTLGEVARRSSWTDAGRKWKKVYDLQKNNFHKKGVFCFTKCCTVRHRVLETNPTDAVSRFLTGDEKLVP